MVLVCKPVKSVFPVTVLVAEELVVECNVRFVVEVPMYNLQSVEPNGT